MGFNSAFKGLILLLCHNKSLNTFQFVKQNKNFKNPRIFQFKKSRALPRILTSKLYQFLHPRLGFLSLKSPGLSKAATHISAKCIYQ